MNQNRVIEGNIFSAIVALSVPIMATSMLQTLYNLMDMFWVGKLGSKAVAAVGTGGFFLWFSFAFITLCSIGAQVGVAQAVGRKDDESMTEYAKTALQLAVAIGVLYSLVLVVFSNPLIALFNLRDVALIELSYQYLNTYGYGAAFLFIISVYTAIWNGYGNSKLPFLALGIAILINLVLDPILIFYFNMGVQGAALATVISHAVAVIVFIVTMPLGGKLFWGLNFFKGFNKVVAKDIIKVGFPAGLQSFMFTSIAVVIVRIIALWGAVAIAVQRLGAQIESITWKSADGIGLATNTFVAQNYGAQRENRIKTGYFTALGFSASIGLFAGVMLIFFGREIFALFIEEKAAIEIGANYAQIIGISQVFMSIEAISGGAFNGLKLTKYPSTVSIVFNALRIPAALLLSSIAALGLNGVWWSISLSSVFKGVVLTVMFLYHLKKMHIAGLVTQE
ncbi:MAG: MATE family efflux transporter [Clostridiales bacterium]|nr:MAG: MATE family efflux transporter [Clostridiales bacterium]